MKAFGSEKKALGQCDRCGSVFPLRTLKYQVVDRKNTNLRVCRSCLDIDQPQWRIGEVESSDAQGLRDPRPFRSYDV